MFCLTNTLFVSGQIYSSNDGYNNNDDFYLTNTSTTTWTLKNKGRDGIITIYYLVLYSGTTYDGKYKITSTTRPVDNTTYVTLKYGSRLATLNIDCFDGRDQLIWARILHLSGI